MDLRVAYFVNQYPKVSHSFIRREILALERRGVDVLRIALRGWDEHTVDPSDAAERDRTRYVLRDGMVGLAIAVLRTALLSPARFCAALILALRMSQGADRPLAYHLAYLAEACVILPWVSAHGSQHLHAHFGTNSAEVAMLAQAMGGPPFSFTVHGPEEFDKAQFIGLAEKIRRAAFVVAISSYGRSQLYRWVGQEHWPKIEVVHCGLEAAFHDVAGVPVPSAPLLVCVGRLCEQKGQLLLMQAVAMLAREGVEFELILAGDGEMRPEVENLIAMHDLASRVRITGWIGGDDVRVQLLAARCLILPSFAEGLPVVIMEAMALRRPVITTCIAGIPELVLHGETGWLVPAGSIHELANAMRDMLKRPVSQLTQMGEAGYHRVLRRHDVDVEAAKLADLFLLSTRTGVAT